MLGRPCKETECRDLGPLEWVPLHAAKSKGAKPLNPTPDPERGNIRITRFADGVEEGRVLSGDELKWAHEHGEELYLSHFVTCPASQRYREESRAKANAAQNGGE